ncbi:PHP domain-containing protein [bacterium]|nr:PHP domain-containing protein [bacterium]
MKHKIDLHVHSRYSGDTNSDPEQTVLKAIECGLHGLAFTEHYYYEASEHVEALIGKYGERIMIFRGVELSTEAGHCLVFGLNTDNLGLKGRPVEEVIETIVEHGGVAVPSHPFRGSTSMGDRVKKLKNISAIEGYNGYSHYAQNSKAVKLAGSLDLPFTGGSDAHESHEVGACYTEFEKKVTYENFLQLLRSGKYKGYDTRKVSRGWVF